MFQQSMQAADADRRQTRRRPASQRPGLSLHDLPDAGSAESGTRLDGGDVRRTNPPGITLKDGDDFGRNLDWHDRLSGLGTPSPAMSGHVILSFDAMRSPC